MKKKILFMVINMNVGGTEKALLNMISEMPKDKYDITVLMLERSGGFLDIIPNGVEVDYVNGFDNMKSMLNEPPYATSLKLFKQGKLKSAFTIIYFHVLAKIMSDRNIFFKYVLKDYPLVKDSYEVAIAYAGPMDFISFFVANKVKAKKKIQWIHFDITKIGFNQNYASKMYSQFDKLFVVSNEGKEKVNRKLPLLKYKTDNFLNIISSKLVMELANNGPGFEDDFSGVRILTVGRLSLEKGQDLTIPVLAKLKEAGYNVRWYCIGDGNAKEEYKKLINEYNVNNDYLLLGAKTNPYPFMKQCDFYVQSSRHEGYCITLAEARCFDNPIISTNFTGAREQITHEFTGLLVNFDKQQMFNAIKSLLENRNLEDKIRNNLRKEIVDTTSEMSKLYEIIDSNHE